MKKNFIKDPEQNKTKTKGIAIQLNTQLYNQIQNQNTPKNKLISDALHLYFNNKEKPPTPKKDIPIELYEEIYSTLHHNEITPLKKKLTHQQETITLLQRQIQELQKDKTFFMTHCTNLINTFQKQKKQKLFSKKTQEIIPTEE
jgi:hypothetical protein